MLHAHVLRMRQDPEEARQLLDRQENGCSTLRLWRMTGMGASVDAKFQVGSSVDFL